MRKYIDLAIEFNKFIDQGIVKINLLESAFSAEPYYEENYLKIASIVRGVIKNHPFKDGNKRTATFLLYILCEDFKLSVVSDDKLADIIVNIAENNYEVIDISKLLIKE